MCAFYRRSLFYQKNPEAARTKHAVKPDGLPDDHAPSVPEFPTAGWTSDKSKFPKITTTTILEHLVNSGKSVSSDKEGDGIVIAKRPLDRANELFFCGYVEDVSVCSKEENVFVLSKCWATQKKHERYTQKVILRSVKPSNSMSVTFAQCQTCVAGYDGGLCSHVLALLLCLESDVEHRPVSVTSMPPRWGPWQRNVDPEPVMELCAEKSKRQRSKAPISNALFEARRPPGRQFSQDNLTNICDVLPKDCIMKGLLPQKIVQFPVQFGEAPFGSVLQMQLKRKPPCQLPDAEDAPPVKKARFPALPLPDSSVAKQTSPRWSIPVKEAQAISKRTVAQSYSKEWIELHKFTITSSNFKKVASATCRQKTLLPMMFDAKPLDHVPAIRHGHDHEDTARKAYIEKKRSEGCSVVVRTCGLVLHPSYRYLGASPDGIVFDASSHPDIGLLEIKCPYTAYEQSLTVEEAAGTLHGFCLSYEEGHLHLDRNHAYWWQVQGQLAITGLRWCDFVVWIKDSVFVKRIIPDTYFWENTMLPKLQAFNQDEAVQYLKSNHRPTPPEDARVPLVTEQPSSSTAPSFCEFEQILSSDKAQGTIAGRNGSNACTIIASVFMSSVLHDTLAGCVNLSQDMLCLCMKVGNQIYDSLGTMSLLSADEVLALPCIDLKYAYESFVRPSHAAFCTLIEVLSMKSNASSDPEGGLFVITPYTFVICFHFGKIIVFDSHSHLGHGALLAILPVEIAADYLSYFFN